MGREGRLPETGSPYREGRTMLLLPENAANSLLGPRKKRPGEVFYNSAMSGSRTRSVLLLKHSIEYGLLGSGKIYAIDGLTASGLRARRWLNEIPEEMAARVLAEIVDLDEISLEWAKASNNQFPPSHGKGAIEAIHGDLRSSVLRSGRHWVDIDPYGSPVPFLDSAMQSMARSGVMEVSATDTAALTGSSKTALMRRYGARVRNDSLSHDSGMRVLLAVISRIAARHDRSLHPLLSIWDSHHLRVSFLVKKGISAANDLETRIGWRVFSPDMEEVAASMAYGFHLGESLETLPMHCFLPLEFPVNRKDPRISGPMWIGPTGDCDAMASMTDEFALESCGPKFSLDDPLGWDEKRCDLERRAISRSVRNISEESQAIKSNQLIVVDDLSSWLGTGAPPSPKRIVESLKDVGHSAGVSSYGRPSFRTDAPWEDVIDAAKSIQPPI